MTIFHFLSNVQHYVEQLQAWELILKKMLFHLCWKGIPPRISFTPFLQLLVTLLLESLRIFEFN